MADKPTPVKVGPGAPLPPQPERVEAPVTIAEAIGEVRSKMEQGTLSPEEEGDAVRVGEAETVHVGEAPEDSAEVGGRGEGEERESARPPEQPEPEKSESAPEEVEEPGDLFTVKLPPRRTGEESIEIDLESLDEDTKEGFRRLMNQGLRRDQLDSAMEHVRTVQAEVQDVMLSMEADPINFIMERTTPELRRDLARHILSDADIYEAVVPELARWDRSPEAREAAMASLERDRVLAQRDAEGALKAREASRANAKQINEYVRGMVPQDAPDHIHELFVDQAMGVIQRYAAQNKLNHLELTQIEPILSQTRVIRLLEAHGGVRATQHPTEPSSAGPAQVAPATSLREAEETAERFRSTSARRRQAAAVAPPGAGSAPVQPPKPPEEVQRSVKKSIEWYRKNVLRR